MVDPNSRSFGAAAQTYESGRPDYPAEAVAWMLEPLGPGLRRVADVGAGTGKLTRAVAALPDTAVIAVDPDELMLDTLRAAVPGIPTHLGTAEELPLPDGSADAVVLGQAWHWVEPVAGCREIGRVVRPGGILGLIWNVRDGGVPWVRRLTEIMNHSNAERMMESGGPTVAEPFAEPERREWRWTRPMTRERLHEMAASRSHLITVSEAERERIHAEMDALFDEAGLDAGGTIDLPYVTSAFRAVREDR